LFNDLKRFGEEDSDEADSELIDETFEIFDSVVVVVCAIVTAVVIVGFVVVGCFVIVDVAVAFVDVGVDVGVDVVGLVVVDFLGLMVDVEDEKITELVVKLSVSVMKYVKCFEGIFQVSLLDLKISSNE
jgi:hypothetical protein